MNDREKAHNLLYPAFKFRSLFIKIICVHDHDGYFNENRLSFKDISNELTAEISSKVYSTTTTSKITIDAFFDNGKTTHEVTWMFGKDLIDDMERFIEYVISSSTGVPKTPHVIYIHCGTKEMD